MAYLLGDLSNLHSDDDWAELHCEIKEVISAKELIKCKEDSSYQIVNMKDGTYYNPEENKWKPIVRK